MKGYERLWWMPGLEMDFTLETNRKRVKEKLLKHMCYNALSSFGEMLPKIEF